MSEENINTVVSSLRSMSLIILVVSLGCFYIFEYQTSLTHPLHKHINDIFMLWMAYFTIPLVVLNIVAYIISLIIPTKDIEENNSDNDYVNGISLKNNDTAKYRV